METRAHARYVRISPRKVKVVLDLIRGRGVNEAVSILRHVPRRAARVVLKLVESAIANAESNQDLDRDELYVAEAYVNPGPTLKRWRPRMRGMVFPILKRTSHVTVVLRQREEGM